MRYLVSASAAGTLCLWSPELSGATLVGQHRLNREVSTISRSPVVSDVICGTVDGEIIKVEFDGLDS